MIIVILKLLLKLWVFKLNITTSSNKQKQNKRITIDTTVYNDLINKRKKENIGSSLDNIHILYKLNHNTIYLLYH